MTKSITIGALAVGISAAAHANADQIQITIDNLQPAGGFSCTPFWFGVHNGGFDTYDSGATLATFPGTETLAELGDTSGVSSAFASSAAGVAGGVDGTITDPSTSPPVFVPGDSESLVVNVGDGSVNRYFSYASMVTPSNDLFVANAKPFAYELFDAAGNFNGPITIDIFGSDVIDAGTEANDALDGPAFVAGQAGTDGLVTNDPVTSLFALAGADTYLQSIVGTSNPLYTVNSAFSSSNHIARITIVPTPGTATLPLVAGAALVVRRRRSV